VLLRLSTRWGRPCALSNLLTALTAEPPHKHAIGGSLGCGIEQMVGGVGTWPWRSNGLAFRTNDEAFPSWQGSIRNVAIRGQVSVGQRLSITGRARGGAV